MSSQSLAYLAEALDNVIQAVRLQSKAIEDLGHVARAQQERLDRIDPDGVGV